MGQQPKILLCLRIFEDATAVKICASLRAGDYVDNHTQKHQRKTKVSTGNTKKKSMFPTETF